MSIAMGLEMDVAACPMAAGSMTSPCASEKSDQSQDEYAPATSFRAAWKQEMASSTNSDSVDRDTSSVGPSLRTGHNKSGIPESAEPAVKADSKVKTAANLAARPAKLLKDGEGKGLSNKTSLRSSNAPDAGCSDRAERTAGASPTVNSFFATIVNAAGETSGPSRDAAKILEDGGAVRALGTTPGNEAKANLPKPIAEGIGDGSAAVGGKSELATAPADEKPGLPFRPNVKTPALSAPEAVATQSSKPATGSDSKNEGQPEADAANHQVQLQASGEQQKVSAGGGNQLTRPMVIGAKLRSDPEAPTLISSGAPLQAASTLSRQDAAGAAPGEPKSGHSIASQPTAQTSLGHARKTGETGSLFSPQLAGAAKGQGIDLGFGSNLARDPLTGISASRAQYLDSGSDPNSDASSRGGSPADTFSGLDGNNGMPAATWIHAGQHRAEAGYLDPALGWVGVRAETVDGVIHASLVAANSESAGTLGGHLAELNAHLGQRLGQEAHVSLENVGSGRADGGEGRGSGAEGQQRRSEGEDHGAVAAVAFDPRSRNFQNLRPKADLPDVGGFQAGRISVIA